MRDCAHCGEVFEPNKYVPNTQRYCTESCRDRARYRGKYRQRKIECAIAWVKENQECYRENARRSYENNRVTRIASSIECHKKNPKIGKRSGQKYRNRWPGRVNAKQRARYARKLKAIPKWADLDKIRTIYELCPPGFHVDHIIPLKGKTVCGLHCEDNLQILSAAENLAKGNRLV